MHTLVRQRQMQFLQSQQESLHTAHQHLEKEQEEVKGQLGTLQRSLNRVRSNSQESRSKVDLLYLCLDKLGLNQVCDTLFSL